jgi:hypothetical protein
MKFLTNEKHSIYANINEQLFETHYLCLHSATLQTKTFIYFRKSLKIVAFVTRECGGY